MSTIRPPAVAGTFYSADPKQLAYDVQQLLAQARTDAPHPSDPVPKALIVPHAGYIYSGAIAATAYATLLSPDRSEQNQSAQEGLSGGSSRNRLASPVTCHNRPIASRIRRVVLLGPTHRVAVRGLALSGADAFDTPLGRVTLDAAGTRAIAHLPQVGISAQAHALEHSLEVQLPFLQSVLSDFTLLPLAVGMASAEEVAEVLETVWGGDETLIVISSDLSHYLPYATAQRVDNETAQSILKLRQPIEHDHACGGTPISGLIVAAQKHHLAPHLLDLRNSGDTAGSHAQVVGYASFAFTEEKSNVH
jgi:AmmeMemoRadiSam system protein B